MALLTTARALGLSDRNNFLVFAYIGLILAIVQGGVYRPLARRVAEVSFMWIGALLMAVGLLGVGAVAALAEQPSPPGQWTLLGLLLAVLPVAVTGFAFMTPSVQSLI